MIVEFHELGGIWIWCDDVSDKIVSHSSRWVKLLGFDILTLSFRTSHHIKLLTRFFTSLGRSLKMQEKEPSIDLLVARVPDVNRRASAARCRAIPEIHTNPLPAFFIFQKIDCTYKRVFPNFFSFYFLSFLTFQAVTECVPREFWKYFSPRKKIFFSWGCHGQKLD